MDKSNISLCDERVICFIKEKECLNIHAKDICVIGEFTIDSFADDYFLTLVTKDQCYEIPMQTKGIAAFIADLNLLFGTNMQLQLASTTKWKSRVLFPKEIADQELYDLLEPKAKTVVQKMKKLFGNTNTFRKLTLHVRKLQELKTDSI